MNSRFLNSVLFACLLWPMQLLTACAQVPAGTVCFEHIGPQDKPMPGFCVQEGQAPGSAEVLIQAGPAAWRDVLAIIEGQGRGSAPGVSQFGDYRAQWVPAARTLYLSARAMQAIVQALQHAPGLTPEQAGLLRRLQLRLA